MVYSFVLLHLTTLFGFISATINTAMVPSDTNIVDMHLVFLQVAITFGFMCATINTTMMPSDANIVDIHLV